MMRKSEVMSRTAPPMIAPKVGREIPALGNCTGVGVAVGPGAGVLVGPGAGVSVGPGIGVEVGPGVEVILGVVVGVGESLGVVVGVGLTAGVVVGVTLGPPMVKVSLQLEAGSLAGAGCGAVGATGSVPTCFSLTAVTTAMTAKMTVAKVMRINDKFCLIFAIFFILVPIVGSRIKNHRLDRIAAG